MNSTHTSRLVAERIGQLTRWLDDEAPYVEFDQCHLDAGTPEQAYWHLGYRAALIDVLSLIKRGEGNIPGIASRSPVADLDE